MEFLTNWELITRLQATESAIARLRAEQVGILRELDRRQAHVSDGCRNVAELAVMHADVAPDTARSVTTTMKRLGDSPELEACLANGEVTFDRAAALACVPGATRETLLETMDLDLASIRRWMVPSRPTTSSHHEQFERRHLTIQPTLDETGYRGWFELPAYGGNVLEKSLDARADTFGSDDGLATRRADALISIAEDALGEDRPSEGGGVSVFIDLDSEAAVTEGGLSTPHEITEQLLCTGSVEVNVQDAQPLGVGRRSRTIPPRLRRALRYRDRGCVIAGCASRYRLEAHHVVPWSEGGRTDADNLVTVCWFHHHVAIHGRGMRIDPDSPRLRRTFLRPRDPPES